MSRNKDLIAIVALALANLVVALLGIENTLLRTLLGLPLVFILPGYALLAALFPDREMELPARALFVLGLSISSLALAGLLLNLLPAGLTALSWAALLFLIILLLSVVAGLRRNRVSWKSVRSDWSENQARLGSRQAVRAAPPAAPQPVPAAPASQPTQRWYRRLVTQMAKRSTQGIMVGLAVLVALFAFGFARIPDTPHGQLGYTLLWLVPEQAGSEARLDLGVQSMEFEPVAYRVELQVNGQVVREFDNILLEPEEQWEVSLDPAEISPGTGTVEAFLYRQDDPGAVYRQVKVSLEPAPLAGTQ